MIGVDITKISRFQNKNLDFVKRILHPEEVKQYNSVSLERQAKFLATRWAIKEAIFKANNKYHNFSDILILHNLNGTYSFANFQISTSDQDDLLVAFVLEVNKER